jgi:hypothetical protein
MIVHDLLAALQDVGADGQQDILELVARCVLFGDEKFSHVFPFSACHAPSASAQYSASAAADSSGITAESKEDVKTAEKAAPT